MYGEVKVACLVIQRGIIWYSTSDMRPNPMPDFDKFLRWFGYHKAPLYTHYPKTDSLHLAFRKNKLMYPQCFRCDVSFRESKSSNLTTTEVFDPATSLNGCSDWGTAWAPDAQSAVYLHDSLAKKKTWLNQISLRSEDGINVHTQLYPKFVS